MGVMKKYLIYKVTTNKKATEAEIEEVDDIDIEKLIERDKPKKPIFNEYIDEAVCMMCGYIVLSCHNFCHTCGQRIDWSE